MAVARRTTRKPRPAGFRADPQDSSPLYLQLARYLSEAVHNGQYAAHSALPSERVLSEAAGVSRVTARKAIDQLVDQGLIERRRGSGNYIATRIEQKLSRLSGFSEELSSRGYAPRSEWLKRELAAATPEEQLALGLGANARVARLERLRLADDVVMAYEISTLPQGVLPRPAEVESSLYAYLERSGAAPVRAVQHIRAINAGNRLADLIGVPVGQALLFITRIGFAKDGKPIEQTHSYCHGDHYDFVAEMRRAR